MSDSPTLTRQSSRHSFSYPQYCYITSLPNKCTLIHDTQTCYQLAKDQQTTQRRSFARRAIEKHRCQSQGSLSDNRVIQAQYHNQQHTRLRYRGSMTGSDMEKKYDTASQTNMGILSCCCGIASTSKTVRPVSMVSKVP